MAFVTDSFTDSNGTALTSHTGETGATWTKNGGGASSATIQGNALQAASITENLYASGTPASAEYDVQFTLTTAANSVFVTGRHDSSADASLNAYLFSAEKANNRYRLYKAVSGSYTTLSTWSSSPADSDVLKLEIRDASKKGYVNGTERTTSGDNVITTAYKAGLRFYNANSTTVTIDDFSATDYSSGTTGTLSATLGSLTAAGVGALAISGSASQTLGALTSSAAGSLAIAGSAAVTLGDATVAAAATLASAGSGTAAVTLGDATVSAAGALAISGSAAVTLGDATVSAEAILLSAGSGAASITLDALTTTATGALAIAGTLGVTLGDATLSSAATLGAAPGSGDASITLDDLTATAAGTLAISGTAAVTLDAATTTATGTVAIAGALGVTLGDITVSANATGSAVITGTADVTLDDVTVATMVAPLVTSVGNRRIRGRAPRVSTGMLPAGRRIR